MKKGMKVLLVSLLLWGCQAPNKTVDLQAAVNVIETSAPSFKEIAMQEMTKDDIAMLLDIEPNLLSDGMGKTPMISMHVDMYMAMTAVEGHEDEVYEAVKTYQEKMASDSFQYPMNLAIIANARIEKEGSQIYYVRCGYQNEDITGLDESAQAKLIQEINEKVVKAIKELY